jgi:serine/threonine protein kinase
VYGAPPFDSARDQRSRMTAILHSKPSYASHPLIDPSLLTTIQSCLEHNPKRRPKAHDLFDGVYMYPERVINAALEQKQKCELQVSSLTARLAAAGISVDEKQAAPVILTKEMIAAILEYAKHPKANDILQCHVWSLCLSLSLSLSLSRSRHALCSRTQTHHSFDCNGMLHRTSYVN